MATYPITFPPKAPNTERLTLTHRQSSTESNTTFAVQTVHTGSQWQLQWTWPRMNHPYAELLNGWLHKLKGQVGTFRYYPRQAYGSTLTGKTLAQTGYEYNETVQLQGFVAGAASTLRVGQYCQIGDQLLIITEAAFVADSTGKVTVSFAPQLRQNYAAGTSVIFTAPSGLFRLNSSADQGFTLDPDRAPEFGTMNAREVI